MAEPPNFRKVILVMKNDEKSGVVINYAPSDGAANSGE